jgi:hypothetical protein
VAIASSGVDLSLRADCDPLLLSLDRVADNSGRLQAVIEARAAGVASRSPEIAV